MRKWALSFVIASTYTPMICRALNRVAVIGGGASGIFSAISAAEKGAAVTVFEAGGKTLTKVKISGGGRCNVMHDASKPIPVLLASYPRGHRELNGLLNKHFTPNMAREWFESRGVRLKTESDGRMFPQSDSSQTIIDTLLSGAEENRVNILHRSKVTCVVSSSRHGDDMEFKVEYQQKSQEGKSNETGNFDSIILATGSVPIGHELASSLGHSIVPAVPSLFTLSTKHEVKEGGVFYGLSGISVPFARVSFILPNQSTSGKKKKKRKVLSQEGPLLITHHGLTAAAALRLSAFGALELAAANYRGELVVHWAPGLGTAEDVAAQLWKMTTTNPKKTVASSCPLSLPATANAKSSSNKDDGSTAIPRRLWASLCIAAGFDPDNGTSASTTSSTTTWGQAPKKLVRKLAALITDFPVEMTGKGTFKEEFVTAGGVALKEVDMKTMESKCCPGLFICGEVLNVDGVTGGFNFMNCWGTGYVAGRSAAAATSHPTTASQ